jgi:DNA-binding transcriptional LysR family regulator
MSLSPRKKRAVLALVEHGEVSKAADACSLSRQTLYRWLREREFTVALREASGSQVAEASRRLDALLMRAIGELEKILDSGSARERRLTADSILSHAVRLRELTELTERISALEMEMKR